MPLQGKKWLPRSIALLLYNHGWVNVDNLCTMVAIIGAESSYYEQAWHWNTDGSTDWGLFQLNDGCKGFPEPGPSGVVSNIKQRTYRDIAWTPEKAVLVARDLYVDRHFQPWAAYANDSYERYVPTACKAICNFLAVHNGLNPVCG